MGAYGYLQIFQHCWDTTVNALVSMINAYVTGPITILCNALDHIVKVTGDCAYGYLQVFQHCWDTVAQPTVIPWITLIWAITMFGTIILVHVILKDVKGLFPWW